ncbi:major head protein [Aeromonas phage pAEv1810]|uniref:major head protein n=1 Tax=Aeromonas phage pAEv1810 TaxID=2908744 RepID=UPI00232960D4|nr:major head protein [Aeromonas phage pAEv1810]UIS25072.1 hypothetical protein pAEv1810_134 [Aeromonas phage pAEv1810]
MTIQFSVKGAGNKGAHLKNVMANLQAVQFKEGNVWAGITGNESLNAVETTINAGIGFNQKSALASAIGSFADQSFADRAAKFADMVKVGGMESFSASMEAGKINRHKAATLELNARGNRQWDAAEELFKTVTIGYADENLQLPIDVAGVGAYNVSGNVNESFEDLRPIASVLADDKFSSGDDLKLVPVYPADANNPNRAAFVAEGDWTPWDEAYEANDLLGREAHKTNYLAIRKANNLMSLCQAPGAPRFEQNDEIESGSIRLNSFLLKIKTKDGEGFATLDTSTMSSTAMRPGTGLTSDEKRQIAFVINGMDVANLKTKAGAPTQLFKTLTDAGLQVFVQFEYSATYQRSTRALSPTVSPVTIAYVMKNGEKLVPGTAGMPADIQALITAQAVEASVHGVVLKMNHNNVNQSRYGTTVVFANTIKNYGVRRRNPISVKYPMQGDDTNADVLAQLIKQMDVLVTREMSHDAFRAAHGHFAYLYDNNGQQMVNINDDSSSVLPGQHFLNTTAVHSKFKLLEQVNTLDSKDALENIRAVLVNKIYDIITALRVNSNVAALKELDGRAEEYRVIAHSSMAPFLMNAGDYRTFGNNVKFEVVETNINSEKGLLWVVPKSNTKDDEIDIYGGMGICVTKELLVIEGAVTQADRQYRMLITQPAYQHHALSCVAGLAEIEDIAQLLSDEGLISAVNKHMVQVSGSTDPVGTQKVEVMNWPATGGSVQVP